jgi:hypothetical protein
MSEKTPNAAYASLRSGNRISLADTSPIAAPLTIYLETTNICNFKCIYCPDTLAAIWHGAPMRDFRLPHLRGDRKMLETCARCTYLYTIPGNIGALSPDTYLSRCSR